MAVAAAAGNLIFILSCIFFFQNYSAAASGADMSFAAAIPFIAYIVLFLNSLLDSGMKKEVFVKNLLNNSVYLFVFAALFAAPIVLKITLPDPHNFPLRKLEILLGGTFAVFAFLMIIRVLRRRAEQADNTLKKDAIYLFFAFLIFYSAVSVWFNRANEPAGDEPIYLLAAHSIIHDRDLDLKNNFDNKDYKGFYSRELKPQGSDIEKEGKLYTYHPLLIAAIIAPFYFIGGITAVVLFMNVLASLFAALIFIYLNNMSGDKKSAFYSASVTGLTLPVLSYMNSVSTEIAGGLVLLASYMLLKNQKDRILLFSLLMACVVWLHVRIMPAYAGIALIFAFYNRGKISNILKFSLIQGASLGLYFLFNYMLLGSIMPSYSDPGKSTIDGMHFKILEGIAVFLIDRQLGFFIYAPVFIFMFAGAFYLWKEKKAVLAELFLILVPYLILICSWFDWGGNNAGPRYFVPVIFVFSAFLAAFIKNIRAKSADILFKTAAACSFVMSLIIMCVPWFRWDKFPADNWIFFMASKFTGLDIAAVFPSFRIPGENSIFLTAAWITGIAAVNLYVIFVNKQKPGIN